MPTRFVCLQALAPLRRDLLALENGADLWHIDNSIVSDVRLYGGLAKVLGDLPQQFKNKSHIGLNATWNDASCWTHIQDRINTMVDFWDVKVTRRAEQTEMIKQMMQEELSSKYFERSERDRAGVVRALLAGDERKADSKSSHSADVTEADTKALQSKFGTSLKPSFFERVTADPIVWPRCPDHLIDFGLIRLLLSIVEKAMSKAFKKIFNFRARDFMWPEGYARLTFDLARTIGSRYSMEFVAKMLLVAVCTWEDLIPADQFSVLQRLFFLRNCIFGEIQTERSLADLKDFTNTWVIDCEAAFGHDVVDKPTFHSLLELVHRDLPLYGNGQLLRTHPYERHLQSK